MTDKTADTSKVKKEPVGKVTRRKSKCHNNSSDGDLDKKDKHCSRCGEHAKDCRARKATCKRCGKTGHFEKFCKSKRISKKDKEEKEKVKRIDDSSDTEDTESQSSDIKTHTSDSEESIRRVTEIPPKSRQAEKLTVHAIRPGRRTRQLHRIGKQFEFKLLLATGRSISILPKKYHSEVRPKRIFRRESTRRFVDVNGKPLSIHNRYKISTKFNETEEDTIWWVLDTDTKPIMGKDNFHKLRLQLIQRQTKEGQHETVKAVKTKAETGNDQNDTQGNQKDEKRKHGSRKSNISNDSHRKNKNTNYGATGDKNLIIGRTETIKNLNFRTLKGENSPSRSPRPSKDAKDAPEFLARRPRLTGQFQKLFTANQTVKNFEYNVQFRSDMKISQSTNRHSKSYRDRSK